LGRIIQIAAGYFASCLVVSALIWPQLSLHFLQDQKEALRGLPFLAFILACTLPGFLWLGLIMFVLSWRALLAFAVSGMVNCIVFHLALLGSSPTVLLFGAIGLAAGAVSYEATRKPGICIKQHCATGNG
jgi:hypothetical protein